MNLRDNLLVTIGSRAAYMEMHGNIQLPTGSHGEDALASFAVKLAEQWLNEETDAMNFDEFIETALEKEFPNSEYPPLSMTSPVVRCRECKHKNTKKCPMIIVNFDRNMEEILVQNHVSDDFFCSYGEKRGNDGPD